jgi:hypothetical protein
MPKQAMATVIIRDVEDWVIRFHQRCALAAGRTLEQELRLVFTEAALRGTKNSTERRLFRELSERLRAANENAGSGKRGRPRRKSR